MFSSPRLLPVFLLSLGSAVSSTSSPLDGDWASEGYGLYFRIADDKLLAYEVTAISCLRSFEAVRKGDTLPEGDVSFQMVDEPVTFALRSGPSPERRRLHLNGTASDIVIEKLSAPPAVCGKPLPDDPKTNFEVFARTWAEQYGFFDLKKADWPSIVASHRSRLTDGTTPEELFEILREMIEPFEDAHTGIRAESLGKRWGGGRRSPTWLSPDERPRAYQTVVDHYLRTPLRSFCQGQVEYGRLDGNVGYLRLRSFSGYGESPGFESGLDALEAALDEIFADASSWPGLVIDVRINGGGDDPYGLAIASRLASGDYLAYSKQARSDPEDPTKWTESQPSWVHPSSRAGFRGPVVELIGIHSVSAAETFTQALLGREPKVTRVGENTQGVFSDVLVRRLPNGWRFGLPNERFVLDGKSYDGAGIPPDVEVAVFPRADLDAGHDGALERALESLLPAAR
jgi:Peptidase family S41/Tricorn protease C1 domain